MQCSVSAVNVDDDSHDEQYYTKSFSYFRRSIANKNLCICICVSTIQLCNWRSENVARLFFFIFISPFVLLCAPTDYRVLALETRFHSIDIVNKQQLRVTSCNYIPIAVASSLTLSVRERARARSRVRYALHVCLQCTDLRIANACTRNGNTSDIKYWVKLFTPSNAIFFIPNKVVFTRQRLV